MNLRVLKEWNDFKEGEIVNSIKLDPSISAEIIADLIVSGTLQPVVEDEEYEDHVITQEDIDENPDFLKNGIKVGDIISYSKLDKDIENLVNTGSANTVSQETSQEIIDEIIPSDREPRLRYNGQIVITDGFRVVGETKYHHIRIEDGSEYDLTPEGYSTQVKRSYPPIK